MRIIPVPIPWFSDETDLANLSKSMVWDPQMQWAVAVETVEQVGLKPEDHLVVWINPGTVQGSQPRLCEWRLAKIQISGQNQVSY